MGKEEEIIKEKGGKIEENNIAISLPKRMLDKKEPPRKTTEKQY